MAAGNRSRRSLSSGASSRRDFLKAAGAVGALAIARGAHAAGQQAITIGMVGAGGRCSGAAAEALQAGPDVKLAAMCDLFPQRVQAARKSLKDMFPQQVTVDDAHTFVGFDGYRNVINSVDVVLVACASKFHPMYAEAAIRAGKHVFVEKPHAIDPVGCRRMQAVCDLAREKGLSLQSGLQSRYYNGYREAVKRIHDGAIGEVVAAQSMFLRGPYRLCPREPGMTETQYQCYNWYHFRWLSGDDVPQSLVHNLDRISWIMKGEMPTWCFGLGGRSASFGEVYGDMFDHHTVVYEYASGARVYALCRTQDNTYGNTSDIIMGTKGECDLGAGRITGPNKWQFKGPGNNPYQEEQKALIEAVRQNKPVNAGQYMAKSTLVTVMGQIACYTGKPVSWEEAFKSNLQYAPPPDQAGFDTPPPSRPDQTGNYPLPMPGITKLV
jgi:predicted dehydrogenase